MVVLNVIPNGFFTQVSTVVQNVTSVFAEKIRCSKNYRALNDTSPLFKLLLYAMTLLKGSLTKLSQKLEEKIGCSKKYRVLTDTYLIFLFHCRLLHFIWFLAMESSDYA